MTDWIRSSTRGLAPGLRVSYNRRHFSERNPMKWHNRTFGPSLPTTFVGIGITVAGDMSRQRFPF
jgi:hypothetical protein